MAARVTQVVTEVLVQPTTQKARVTQLAVEALYPSDLPPAPAGATTQRWDGSGWVDVGKPMLYGVNNVGQEDRSNHIAYYGDGSASPRWMR